MDVQPSHRLPAAALLLALVGCNSPAADTGDSPGTTSITTATGSGVPTEPTDSAVTDIATATPSSPVCDDGAARCTDDGDRQVCSGGAWVDAACPEGQGCQSDDGACQACTCEPGTAVDCADGKTLEVCTCFDATPQPCGPSTVCEDLGGDIACHKIVCEPGETDCDTGDVSMTCNGTGTAWMMTACATTETCDPGSGACMDACAVVAKNDASLGCEFWAVDMPNVPPRNDFVYAVALSNPSNKADAHITVYDSNLGGSQQKIASGTVSPRDVEIFALSGTSNNDHGFYPSDAGFLGTGIARGRAFRVVSDVPIVATQFNPLGGAAAFTTDASLLLPTHALGKSYLHLAWDKGSGAGSTLVVVATADNTNITITPTVSTVAGQNNMPALQAGVATKLPLLKRHDYVQLSAPGKDLSASKITADKPVALFGGHSCGQVPDLGTGNCDHLEEQIFPIDTWGEHYVAARSPQRNNEAMVWRVLAAEAGTTVAFDPPVSIGTMTQLGAGEMAQFSADGDFEISTNPDHPVLVAGYMYGCKAAEVGPECPGDPSMVLVVPAEQWTDDYVFHVDFSYTNDSVKLVRETGEKVSLGCLDPVTGWQPVTDAYESAVVHFDGANDCKAGTNTATGDAPFAIMVVGESESASYAYPGGLQLKPINPQ